MKFSMVVLAFADRESSIQLVGWCKNMRSPFFLFFPKGALDAEIVVPKLRMVVISMRRSVSKRRAASCELTRAEGARDDGWGTCRVTTVRSDQRHLKSGMWKTFRLGQCLFVELGVANVKELLFCWGITAQKKRMTVGLKGDPLMMTQVQVQCKVSHR